MAENGRGIARFGPLCAAVLGVGFIASSAWLAVLMPRNGFASPPPGTVVTHDELLAALDTSRVTELLRTADQNSDIVARTRTGDFVVYRASLRDPTRFADPDAAIADVLSRAPIDALTAGQSDPALAAYAGTIAQVPPPNAAIAVLAWWISLLGGLSLVMYWAAGRTSFRFSVPFGPFGVGTDHSP